MSDGPTEMWRKLQKAKPGESVLVDKKTMKQLTKGTLEISPTNLGWVCPVCKRGISPFQMTCDCAGYKL